MGLLQDLAPEIPTSAGSYVESLSPLPASDQCSPILVMKKLELREGKSFIRVAQPVTTSSALAPISCLPCPELSGGTSAPTTKMLEWCPLHLYQGLKELSGKFSKTNLSFPLAPGRSRWSQAGRMHCSRDLCTFAAKAVATLGERVH